MKQKWEVERSRKQCSSCMVEFAAGSPFFSALYPLDGGGFERRDFCISCWRRSKEAVAPDPDVDDADAATNMQKEQHISFWKTRIKPAEKKRAKLSFEPHVALTIFSQVQKREKKSPDEIRLAFILALSLARRKMLVIKGTHRADGRSFLRVSRRGGDEYKVEDPGMSEQDILSMLDKVGELLEMNLGDETEAENEPGAPEAGNAAQPENEPGETGAGNED